VNNSGTGSVSILANSKVVNNPGEMIPDPQDPEGMIPGDGVYAPQAGPIANQAEFDKVGTLRIADSTVSGNYAEQNGGGVANLGSGTLTIERSTITDNTTEAQGGGVYSTGGKLTVTGGTISANHAQDGGGISSGGEAQVTITDVTISENTAGEAGGGLNHSGRASLALPRATFTGNRAEIDGGGIYNSSSGPFTILATTVEKNSALSGGGLANAPDNDLIVKRSLFLRNTPRNPGISEDGDPEDGGIGGGIFSLADGDSRLENTTISGNVAAKGGGAFQTGSEMTAGPAVRHILEAFYGVEQSPEDPHPTYTEPISDTR
jgi:hypothetical protein